MLPIEMQCLAYWITDRGIDQLDHGEHLDTFTELIQDYLIIFEQEERLLCGENLYQTPIMKNCWETGSFWYFHAINTPKGLFRVFNEHIQRLFCEEHCDAKVFDDVVAPYWSIGAADVIDGKISEEGRYKDQLREAFAPQPCLQNEAKED